MKRLEWLDLARSFAIICVVVCHAAEHFYLPLTDSALKLSLSGQIAGYVFFTIGRLGVPIFLFLTGYLLLTRKYETKEDIVRFWLKKLLPLYITFVIWTLLNQIFLTLFDGREFDVLGTVLRALTLAGSPMGHMWYMPMILGIYLLLPLVANVVQRFEASVLLVPMAFGFAFLFIVPGINLMFDSVNASIDIAGRLDLHFTGGAYGIYVVLGYLFATYGKSMLAWNDKVFQDKWIPALLLFLISIVSFAGMVALQLWSVAAGNPFKVWYEFPLLPICCTSLFLLAGLLFHEHVPGAKVWESISISAMGIYFLHFLILRVLYKNALITTLFPGKMSGFFACAVIAFLISWLTVSILSFVPYLSKYLFMRSRTRRLKNPE